MEALNLYKQVSLQNLGWAASYILKNAQNADYGTGNREEEP